MLNIIKVANVIIVLSFLGCATTTPTKSSVMSGDSNISLNQDSIQYITSSDIYVGFAEHEVIPYKESRISQYTLGGLIPALIDVSINSAQWKKMNQESVLNIGDALRDYKLRETFTDQLRKGIGTITWLHAHETSLLNSASDQMYGVYYSLSKASAVLFITTRYSFSSDFKILIITNNVTLFPKDDKLKQFAQSWSDNKDNPINDHNCIYKKTIEDKKALNREVATKEDAILLWGYDKASLLRKALEDGISEVTQMIVVDLNKIADNNLMERNAK